MMIWHLYIESNFMNSSNTLYIIASFLDYKSLARFSIINKRFYNISQISELWKTLLMIEYFGSYEIFGYFIFRDISKEQYWRKSTQDDSIWKNLLKKRVILQCEWKALAEQSWAPSMVYELSNLLFKSLYEPDVPIPALTREAKSFSTIFQNLIGQMVFPPPPMFFNPPGVLILKTLYSQLENFKNEINDEDSIQQLFRLKWIVSKNDSSLYSRVQRSQPESIIFKLTRYIKKTIKIHCKSTVAVLSITEEPRDLTNDYCIRVSII